MIDMGMDYKYSGSASYGRFNKELCAVAEIFGAIKTDNLKARETDVVRCDSKHNIFHNVFGTYSVLKAVEPKFVFPKGTNKTLAKWFENVYGKFTVKETFEVAKEFIKHPEIRDISEQIWNELLRCAYYEEPWHILR